MHSVWWWQMSCNQHQSISRYKLTLTIDRATKSHTTMARLIPGAQPTSLLLLLLLLPIQLLYLLCCYQAPSLVMRQLVLELEPITNNLPMRMNAVDCCELADQLATKTELGCDGHQKIHCTQMPWTTHTAATWPSCSWPACELSTTINICKCVTAD